MKNIFFVVIAVFVSTITAQNSPWASNDVQITKMAHNSPIDSSDIIMDIVLKSKVPVIMDFWAPWCGPCRMLGPILEEIKKEYGSKVKIIKVNIDENAKIAGYFQVQSIPAVFFVKNKAVAGYLLGYRQKDDYTEVINKLLAPSITNADTSSQPASTSKKSKK